MLYDILKSYIQTQQVLQNFMVSIRMERVSAPVDRYCLGHVSVSYHNVYPRGNILSLSLTGAVCEDKEMRCYI